MTNKKSWLQRSVETLGLSNYGDERILAEIVQMYIGIVSGNHSVVIPCFVLGQK